jgi:hypothetical protein
LKNWQYTHNFECSSCHVKRVSKKNDYVLPRSPPIINLFTSYKRGKVAYELKFIAGNWHVTEFVRGKDCFNFQLIFSGSWTFSRSHWKAHSRTGMMKIQLVSSKC